MPTVDLSSPTLEPRVRPACRRLLLGVALGLLLVLLHGSRRPASAESAPEFKVIVHPDNPISSLSRASLTDLYLKRVTRWGDGETARPVDQSAKSAVRAKFSDSVLQRSVSAVKRYWQQRIFSGRDLPPPEIDGDDAVVSYVAKHRGAVGYVSSNTKLDHAKLVSLQ